MREAMREADFERFRADVETRLVRKRMRPLRECVDRAGSRALDGGDGAAVLRECRAAELLAETRACGDVFADSLYDLATLSGVDPSAPRAARIRAKTQSRIEQVCP